MVRMMVGDALQGENKRLQTHMNQLLDKVESTCANACAQQLGAADAARCGSPRARCPGGGRFLN